MSKDLVTYEPLRRDEDVQRGADWPPMVPESHRFLGTIQTADLEEVTSVTREKLARFLEIKFVLG